MMGRLDRYLLRRMLGAFALALVGISGLAVVLDVLANADKAVEATGSVGDIWVYALARLPLIGQRMAPIAALLAALLTLLTLSRSGELAAAASLGASQARVVRALLPAAAAIGLGLFLVGEIATPPAAAVLRDMGLNPFARIAQPTDAIWLRQDNDVVRLGGVSADEATLTDVTIFRRDDAGALAFEIRASRATRIQEGWRLHDVKVLASDLRATEAGDVMDWPSAIGPGSFKMLAAHPAELPIRDVRRLAASPGFSPKPRFFYDHWVNRKIATAISAGLLVLLAAPFAGRMARGRSIAVPLALGLLAGFGFFVFENLATAAAESGAIGPVAGAWGPTAILACAILAMIAFQERPG